MHVLPKCPVVDFRKKVTGCLMKKTSPFYAESDRKLKVNGYCVLNFLGNPKKPRRPEPISKKVAGSGTTFSDAPAVLKEISENVEERKKERDNNVAVQQRSQLHVRPP